MNDERIQSLVNQGAEINIKVNKRRAVVIIGHEEQTYTASGKNIDSALERCLSAVGSHDKNVRQKRKEKERERRELLEDEDGYVSDGHEETKWF